MRSIFLLLGAAFLSGSISAQAQISEFDTGKAIPELSKLRVIATLPADRILPYVQGALEAHLPTQYALTATNYISKIQIIRDDQFDASFYIPNGFATKGILRLSESYYIPSEKRVVHWEERPTAQRGTILHELWHAYFLLHLKKRNADSYRAFQRRAQKIFPKIPSQYRLEIYEEVLAFYIESILPWFGLSVEKLSQATLERRKEIRNQSILKKHYRSLANDVYEGYAGRNYYQTWRLQKADRDLLNQRLFSNHLSGVFSTDFSEKRLKEMIPDLDD